MVQFTGRQDFALDQAKVLVDVRMTGMGTKVWMSFGVDTRLVDPGVQGGDIDVMDLLAGGGLMVQFHGIGTSSTESVAGIEGFCHVKVSYKCTNVR